MKRVQRLAVGAMLLVSILAAPIPANAVGALRADVLFVKCLPGQDVQVIVRSGTGPQAGINGYTPYAFYAAMHNFALPAEDPASWGLTLFLFVCQGIYPTVCIRQTVIEPEAKVPGYPYNPTASIYAIIAVGWTADDNTYPGITPGDLIQPLSTKCVPHGTVKSDNQPIWIGRY